MHKIYLLIYTDDTFSPSLIGQLTSLSYINQSREENGAIRVVITGMGFSLFFYGIVGQFHQDKSES